MDHVCRKADFNYQGIGVASSYQTLFSRHFSWKRDASVSELKIILLITSDPNIGVHDMYINGTKANVEL